MEINIKKLKPEATIPEYKKIGDSGFDLRAAQDCCVKPGETMLIPTGLAFEIPRNYELQVRPRSGMSLKTKIRVSFGTVDSNYRGDVGIILDNLGDTDYTVKQGDRIAQGVVAPIQKVTFIEVDELSSSERKSSGFGSTGIK